MRLRHRSGLSVPARYRHEYISSQTEMHVHASISPSTYIHFKNRTRHPLLSRGNGSHKWMPRNTYRHSFFLLEVMPDDSLATDWLTVTDCYVVRHLQNLNQPIPYCPLLSVKYHQISLTLSCAASNWWSGTHSKRQNIRVEGPCWIFDVTYSPHISSYTYIHANVQWGLTKYLYVNCVYSDLVLPIPENHERLRKCHRRGKQHPTMTPNGRKHQSQIGKELPVARP